MEHVRPINYKFRFTFTEQDKKLEYDKEIPRWKQISKYLVDKLLQQYTITKLTGGIETLNRAGDRTWCHLHLHFDAVENRDTIARFIKRYLADTYDQQVVGVKYFMLKPDVARHLDDFMRYPLKQSLNEKLCYGYTKDELQVMHQAAQSSYLKCQEVNQAKMDKSDSSDTLFQRLKIYLDKTSDNKSRISLLMLATKFYVEEDKPINRNTIQGYVDTYMLQNEYITYEQYWQQYGC